MSLQSDFELCLEYAEALEAKQDQRVQAQSNIIFVQNESRRLKNKLRICTTLSLLSAIGVLILVLAMNKSRTLTHIDFLPYLAVPVVVFIVSFINFIKTKKESGELESRKFSLIQEYTTEADECERVIVALVKEIYQEDLFEIVPSDYFCTAAIEFCLTRIRKKLANSAKEAFQQLDTEIKRLEHMEYLERVNNAQMEQLDEIKKAIQINTLITLIEEDKKYS